VGEQSHEHTDPATSVSAAWDCNNVDSWTGITTGGSVATVDCLPSRHERDTSGEDIDISSCSVAAEDAAALAGGGSAVGASASACGVCASPCTIVCGSVYDGVCACTWAGICVDIGAGIGADTGADVGVRTDAGTVADAGADAGAIVRVETANRVWWAGIDGCAFVMAFVAAADDGIAELATAAMTSSVAHSAVVPTRRPASGDGLACLVRSSTAIFLRRAATRSPSAANFSFALMSSDSVSNCSRRACCNSSRAAINSVISVPAPADSSIFSSFNSCTSRSSSATWATVMGGWERHRLSNRLGHEG